MRSSGKARKAKKNPQRLGQGSSFNHGRDLLGGRDPRTHHARPKPPLQASPKPRMRTLYTVYTMQRRDT
jgi:hypothetical protein